LSRDIAILLTFVGARLSIPVGSNHDQPLASADVSNGPLDLNIAAVEYHYDNSNPLGYADEELDEELTPQETQNRFEGELAMIHDIYKHTAGQGADIEYKTFLHSGILEHYDAERVAHPLKNSHTARVFMHFLTATAMSVSIFERKPLEPAVESGFFFVLQPYQSHQGLWTYVLPMMALSHQGLLHAMLSLSSLQIAKLQNTSPTPAYKHYAYAIKRIHNCVGQRRKRSLPSTLAATLLLAFYEVMTADHQKWCSHLSGAAQLVSEINFRRMAAMARKQQMDMAAEDSIVSTNGGYGFSDILTLDDDLVNVLTGREFTYDLPDVDTRNFDSQKYQLFADLYWWYVRQDTFQSIIAGNRLL
jgi:Fungal specific transcription factor domain